MGGKNPLTGKREGGLFDRISNTFADFRDKPLMEAISCMWTNFSGIEKAVYICTRITKEVIRLSSLKILR